MMIFFLLVSKSRFSILPATLLSMVTIVYYADFLNSVFFPDLPFLSLMLISLSCCFLNCISWFLSIYLLITDSD